jgi:hypothetical protein
MIADFKEKGDTLAEQLIQDELLTFLWYDAHAFPVIVQAEADGKRRKSAKRQT